MAELKLISEWSQQLTEGEYATLEKGNNAYHSFDGVTLKGDNLGNVEKGVNIGIYQAGDNVYAFASTKVEFDDDKTITNGGGNEAENNATLIASGTGDLSTDNDNKKLTNIQITLKAPQEGKTFKQLGFSGEDITKIEGSSANDKIYIISDQDKNGVSEEAVLDFGQNGNDSVVFSGSTTIKSITSGGGYTRLRVRGHPRAEGF